MMRAKILTGALGEFKVYQCSECGRTYRSKIIIKTYWLFCPGCACPIDKWEDETDVSRDTNE